MPSELASHTNCSAVQRHRHPCRTGCASQIDGHVPMAAVRQADSCRTLEGPAAKVLMPLTLAVAIEICGIHHAHVGLLADRYNDRVSLGGVELVVKELRGELSCLPATLPSFRESTDVRGEAIN